MLDDRPPVIPQKFVVSHADESEFVTHHYRNYLQMRDLGVAGATEGQVAIHIAKVIKPFRPGDDVGAHYHKAAFQYFFVLKGWQRMAFEGQKEEIVMRAGSGWVQPTGIKHEVLDYSEDFEVLCINMPQKFETVVVDHV